MGSGDDDAVEDPEGLDDGDLDGGDDDDMEDHYANCLAAQSILFRYLQNGTEHNLLQLAISGELEEEILTMPIDQVTEALVWAADWVDKDTEFSSGLARELMILHIEGIAGLFLYHRWPITDEWIRQCEELGSPDEINDLDVQVQGETLVRFAHALNVPTHLFEGMLTFCMLDIPFSEPH
jgi:hypothetical protein